MLLDRSTYMTFIGIHWYMNWPFRPCLKCWNVSLRFCHSAPLKKMLFLNSKGNWIKSNKLSQTEFYASCPTAEYIVPGCPVRCSISGLWVMDESTGMSGVSARKSLSLNCISHPHNATLLLNVTQHFMWIFKIRLSLAIYTCIEI